MLSRITSRHHWSIVSRVVNTPILRTVVLPLWNQIASPEAISREPMAPVRGHGLGSTKWYWWSW